MKADSWQERFYYILPVFEEIKPSKPMFSQKNVRLHGIA